MRLPVFRLFLLLAAFVGSLLTASAQGVEIYEYRDEGGTVVFVTDRFDLILPGRQWPHGPDKFLAGSSILEAGFSVRVTDKKGKRSYQPLSPNDGPVFNLKPGNRLEIILPGLVATLVGDVLEIGEEKVALGPPRTEVVVDKAGKVTSKQLPEIEGKEALLNRAKALSARWKQPGR